LAAVKLAVVQMNHELPLEQKTSYKLTWAAVQPGLAVVKVKVEVKFTLEQATKAQKGRERIALLFL
jgi:hypothetical protein